MRDEVIGPVLDDSQLSMLLEQARNGDSDTINRLVSVYTEPIRRFVRVQLRQTILRRRLDSGDICQSVFADFFVRARLGLLELDNPKQLFALLSLMARNKLTDERRANFAQCRDVRRTVSDDNAIDAITEDSTPSRAVAHEELVAEFRKRMTEEERLIADQRLGGIDWGTIAAQFNQSPSALRQRFMKSMDRISAELGL